MLRRQRHSTDLSRFDKGRPCANDFLKKKFDNNAMRRQEMDAGGDDILTKVTGSQTCGFRKTTERDPNSRPQIKSGGKTKVGGRALKSQG